MMMINPSYILCVRCQFPCRCYSTMDDKNVASLRISHHRIMTFAFAEGWISAGLPANEPHDISRAIATAAVRPDLNGRTLWTSGGNPTQIEDRFLAYEGREHWIGKQNNEDWEKGAELLKAGYTLPDP
jgi:hypothetical protein